VSASVQIRRITGLFGARRNLEVLIDGQWVGSIRLGETASFQVEPGLHRVGVKMDWTKAPPLEVACSPGSTVDLDVVVPSSAGRATLRTVLSPNRVFEVRPGDRGLEESDLALKTPNKLIGAISVLGLCCWLVAALSNGSPTGSAFWVAGFLLIAIAIGIRRTAWKSG
jgi:hypothetical protein